MNNTKHTARTADGRMVTIRTRQVGVNFGCVGQVIARNGRVLAETDTMPHGFDHVAEARAAQLAYHLGEHRWA